MKSFEFVGKNIEKAIENGLKELNKSREDVDISILSEGGLFSKAKVKISFDEAPFDEIADEIAKKEFEDVEVEACSCGCGCKDELCQNEGDHCACGCTDCDCGESVREEKQVEECKFCKDEIIATSKNEEADSALIQEKKKHYLTSEEVFDEVNAIFENIFKALNINGKVMILENDDAYEVKVSGDEKISALIGYRGEALNAYQILINSFISLKDKSKKILLDVENYRNRREESLKNLAIRIAKKVVKTKHKHKFEPMSSFERHVIHEALSDFDGVSTHSEGVEPKRCLIVEPVTK